MLHIIVTTNRQYIPTDLYVPDTWTPDKVGTYVLRYIHVFPLVHVYPYPTYTHIHAGDTHCILCGSELVLEYILTRFAIANHNTQLS